MVIVGDPNVRFRPIAGVREASKTQRVAVFSGAFDSYCGPSVMVILGATSTTQSAEN
jgi:hypothetical protein